MDSVSAARSAQNRLTFPGAAQGEGLLPVALLGGAVFTSAFLLFWVQPLFSKMVLPLLGGSPSVWNTAMMFFQLALLAGYGYAHLLTHRIANLRGQMAVHGIVVMNYFGGEEATARERTTAQIRLLLTVVADGAFAGAAA